MKRVKRGQSTWLSVSPSCNGPLSEGSRSCRLIGRAHDEIITWNALLKVVIRTNLPDLRKILLKVQTWKHPPNLM